MADYRDRLLALLDKLTGTHDRTSKLQETLRLAETAKLHRAATLGSGIKSEPMTPQTHMERLEALLEKKRGKKEDVMSIEYRAIDLDTTKEELDCSTVRGSVRLADPSNVLLPRDTDILVKEYLATPLP